MILLVTLILGQIGPAASGPIAPPTLPPLPSLSQPMAVRTGPEQPLLPTVRTNRAGSSLGLADLEQLALQNHPTLEQSRARTEEARQRAVQAGLYPNPEIAYDHDDINEDQTFGEHGPFIDQPIVLAGKLRINRDRFLIETEQARWLADLQRLRIINGVRLRYYQLLALHQLIALNDRMAETADRIARLTEEKAATEDVKRSDVLTARNAARRTRLERHRLRQRLDETRRELASYVGLAELPPLPIVGSLEAGVPVGDWDTTLEHLIRQSPELHANAMRVRREDYTIRRERAAVVPDLILRLGYNFDHTVNQFTPMWRLTLVDVPIWNQNQGNIREAEANRRYYRLNADRLQLQLQHRLAEQFARYRTSLETVLEYRDHILPDAQEAFEIDLDLFRAEEGDYSRVQSSQENLFDAQVSYTEALLELRQAEVRIHGLLVEDTLDEPEAPAASGRPTRQPGVAP